MRLLLTIIFFSVPFYGATQVVHDYVYSNMNSTVTLFDGTTTNFWGFGKYNTGLPLEITFPGPLLSYTLGDSVALHYRNDGLDEHTIHLHGLDVDQANDGVPFTSFAIPAGDSIIYSFEANDPGLYLYHCHVATVFHLAMGMYGMLAIDHPDNLVYDGGPGYNKVHHYLSSDMDKSWNDNPNSPGPFYEYSPNYFFINGLSNNQLFSDTTQIIYANSGDSILLRLANIGYTEVEYCFPEELNASIHSSDGRILPNVVSQDTLKIFPGERYSLLLHPTSLVSDYVTVNVYGMIQGELLGTNHIGVNNSAEPNSTQEESNTAWKIYPNPFENEIIIERPENEWEKVILYDHTGQFIRHFLIEGQRSTISIEDLLPGVYLLKSETSGLSHRIVKL